MLRILDIRLTTLLPAIFLRTVSTQELKPRTDPERLAGRYASSAV